jgi:hypothetical protein
MTIEMRSISGWVDPADDERQIAFTKQASEATRPFTTGGVYLNFTHEDRVREAYGVEQYRRLVALKDKHDPENLLSLNQNIKPGTG